MRRDFLGSIWVSAALGVLLSAAVLAPAFAQEVSTNYVPGTDFSKFQNYRWAVIEGGSHPSPMMDAEIKMAVDQQLAKKGLEKLDGTAGLTITYQVAIEKDQHWSSLGTGASPWGGIATTTNGPLGVGTIVLDFYDPVAKQLVWQGQATKTLDPQSSLNKNQKNLDKAMKKLLKDFPPKTN